MDNLIAKLKIGGVDTQYDVHPVFSDNMKLSIEREEEQIFRREKIDGTFQFVGEDFDLIDSCGDSIQFTLLLYRGAALVGTGTFYKTDCTIDYDNKNISIKLTTTDVYEKFLANYDNKYNLVKLAPMIRQMSLRRRGVLQIYAKGEKVLTNIVGGMSFEQTAAEVTDINTLINTYKFSSIAPMAYISISASQILDQSIADAVGNYFMYHSITSETILYKQEGGHYHIQVTDGYGINTALLIDDNTSQTVAIGDITSTDDGAIWEYKRTQSGVTTTKCRSTYNKDGNLYGRYLCPSDTHDTYIVPRPTEDICEYDANYPYVRPSGSGDIVPRLAMITKRSADPTPWGIDSSMRYFTAPELSDEQKADGVNSIPVGQSHWGRFSTWIVLDAELRNVMDLFNNDFTLKDAYPLWSAIKVLLAKVAPNLHFGNSSTYSQFLAESYAQASTDVDIYPFPRSRNNYLFITPITNVKKTYYEQAAQRGDISLKQVLDMLRKVFRCYWWIDSSNNLRIEHITYFKNGNTYKQGSVTPSMDVTQMLDYPPKKTWSFNTNKVEFDDSKCPSRYEFKWGDGSSEPFTGVPIDIKDNFVDNSKKETVTVDNFITDVDYVIINPKEVSDDLYALLEGYSIGSYQVPIANVRLGADTPIYKLQNAYLSFLFIEKNYYPYDLAGWRAVADTTPLDVYDVKAIKKQNLVFPCTLAQARTLGLVRTGIGDGEIEKMSLNADTLMATTDLSFVEAKDYIPDIAVTYEPHVPNRHAYLNNNTDKYLWVTYAKVRNNKIVSISKGGVYPKGRTQVLNVSITDTTIINVLKVEDITAFTYKGIFHKEDGIMSVTEEWVNPTKTKITFDGKMQDGRDWAMLRLVARQNLEITIQASSENNYDIGWADDTPRGNSASGALYKASGTATTTFYLNVGESIYIGYTKDSSQYSNQDKIVFEIVAI